MQLTMSGVGKRYGGRMWALRDFDLTLGPGILGLLGPNGAGKSTLMRILATITRPNAGTVTWNDQDIARAPDSLRRVLGYLPQDFGVYPNLTATEFLEYIAAVKGIDGRKAHGRVRSVLELVNLADAADRPLGGYSGGMKQRVGIAQALLNDPQLLIVDEPTVGLDPEERVRFRNLLTDLAGERIVILSTHIVSDVEATAGNIAVVDRGRLLRRGSPAEILRAVEGRVWEWLVPSAELASVKSRHIVSGAIRRGDDLNVRLVNDTPPDPAATPAPPTLEDAYLYLLARHRGNGR